MSACLTMNTIQVAYVRGNNFEDIQTTDSIVFNDDTKKKIIEFENLARHFAMSVPKFCECSCLSRGIIKFMKW